MDFFTAHKYNISLKNSNVISPKGSLLTIRKPVDSYLRGICIRNSMYYEILEGHNKNKAKICVQLTYVTRRTVTANHAFIIPSTTLG